MLANGAKLGYSKTAPSGSSTTYTDLPGLKEIPDIGSDPEKVAMDTSVSEENYMFPTADRTAVTVVVAEM